MKGNKKGFTLIEILVAVLIIGVLAAIAIPGYRKSVEKAKAAEAVAVLNEAAKAEQDFALNSSRYTSYWEDLIVNQPNVVAGTVYCLKGTNTANQDDCGSDSIYKVKLTVGDNDKSVVMATRTPNNPYADYKLFKFMNGDPNIYCKAATNSQTDICTVLGLPTRILPETRNIDHQESIDCNDLQGSMSNASDYTCERITYDDGSYDENAYYANGNLYDVFSFDAEGKQTGDTWYFDDGDEEGYSYYENGNFYGYSTNRTKEGIGEPVSSAYVEYDAVTSKLKMTLWVLEDGHLFDGDAKLLYRTYDDNGKWETLVGYYETGNISGYRSYDTSANKWGYFAQYNEDGSIKKFTCYTSMCGGSGTCEGAACASSQYATYIPASNTLPEYTTRFTEDRIDKVCKYSTRADLCQ
ncbi:MAG: prepilin-type N-terminal cleavage/methylation domain-containing protein [Elusimicrobiaceae bacterium]|nr:prepilin-type N-terminal cleavage/methylation domain-containing protein [Elusimicrobiaceae bacterium]